MTATTALPRSHENNHAFPTSTKMTTPIATSADRKNVSLFTTTDNHHNQSETDHGNAQKTSNRIHHQRQQQQQHQNNQQHQNTSSNGRWNVMMEMCENR